MKNTGAKTMMNKDLAEALIRAGMHHFDIGGSVASGINTVTQPGLSLATGVAQPVGSALGDIAGDFTTQNQYQATAPNISTQEANYGSANAGQNSLEGQLTAESNGQGPNPAATLTQNTIQQNAAQANALAQSQRGVNPGLAARDATLASTSANQAAAGTGAALAQEQQLAAQGQLAGVLGQQENAATQNAGVVTTGDLGAETLNQKTAQGNATATNTTEGGLLNGIGGALGLSKGGEVPEHIKAMAELYHTNKLAKGGEVPALVSPGEKYLKPAEAKKVAQGKESPMKAGETIPGKAPVKGDSYKNDIVPKKLEKGGVVIPRSVMESSDPEKEAAKFVVDHLAKNGGSKKHKDDFKDALKRAVSERRSK